MRSSQPPPLLSTFPQDGKRWRLQTVGYVQPAVAFERSVKVLLTSHGGSEQTLSAAGAGWFPLLQPGSIWRDGKLLGTQPRDPVSVAILVDSNTMATLPANRLMTQRPRLVPGETFGLGPWPDLPCLVVADAENPGSRFIIPCGEVFRAFYAMDSETARVFLLDDTMSRLDEIYCVARSSMSANHCQVHLRKRVHNEATSIAALLVGSQDAREVAANIMREVYFAVARMELPFLRVTIPFRGVINMVVERTPLSKTEWFVNRIVRVSIALPWHVSRYRDNPGKSSHPVEDPWAEKPIPKEVPKLGEDPQLVADESPFAAYKRLNLMQRLGVQIEPLFPIKSLLSDDAEPPAGRSYELPSLVDMLSTALPDYTETEGKPAPVNIQFEPRETIPDQAKLIRFVIDAFGERFPDAILDTATLVFPCQTFGDEPLPWSWMTEKRKRIRARSLFLARVEVEGRKIIFCEIEKRPTDSGFQTYVFESGKQPSEDEMNDLMVSLSECSGVWKVQMGSRSKTYSHRFKPENFIQRVIDDFGVVQ